MYSDGVLRSCHLAYCVSQIRAIRVACTAQDLMQSYGASKGWDPHERAVFATRRTCRATDDLRTSLRPGMQHGSPEQAADYRGRAEKHSISPQRVMLQRQR